MTPLPVRLTFKNAAIALQCRALEGEERIGEGLRFELTAFSEEPVATADVVGQIVHLDLGDDDDGRGLYALVTKFTAIARVHSKDTKERRYRLSLRSPLMLMEQRRRPRIFQKMTVPAIVQKVLHDAGWDDANVVASLHEKHPVRPYVVQYAETDAAFVRRMCEEDGLYFRFEEGNESERFLLEDASAHAPSLLGAPLTIVDETDLTPSVLVAYPTALRARRRVGKVTLRDFDYEHANVKLEAVSSAGTAVEKGVEVYEAPGRFADDTQGKRRADLRLDSLRADGVTFSFVTNARALQTGTKVSLEPGNDYRGMAIAHGDYLVVALRHRWRIDDERQDTLPYRLTAEVIPLTVPFRLPRLTPRPRIHGLHPARVTGPPGEEIHTDKQGRISVKFHWDREGPLDDKSSLPIRVMQPNTPGSMIIPRIGWEVLVGFEDGDPDRPIVVGRAFNAKQPPPQALPANKTISSVATHSSPGSGKMNAIHFDDASGRQNLRIVAAFGKATTVANDMKVQTAKVEKTSIKGSQGSSVGANDDVSVKQAYVVQVGSQSASVGAVQKIYVKGDMIVSVGSESVLVGAALLEKVGNPVSGALNLASSAALAGVGALGKAGAIASQVGGLAKAGIEGAMHGGGWRGAAHAVAGGVIGSVAGMVPGGDSLLSAVGGAGALAPWAPKPPAAGAAAAGGGAGGAEGDGSGAKGPGPGHRTTSVKGTYTELIGALHAIVTPGSISWQTLGASTFLVGGSHSTKTRSGNSKVLGASTEVLGSLKIKTGTSIGRDVKGVLSTKIAGALDSDAGGKHQIKAGAAVNIKIGGTLTLDGSHVTFVVGGSKLSSSPSGVLIEAASIEITGASKQSGGAEHA